MFGPENLSFYELNKFHKVTREKIECAIEDTSEESKWMQVLNPGYNRIKSEGRVVLRMIDDELKRRGYNPEKLFKDYKCD